MSSTPRVRTRTRPVPASARPSPAAPSADPFDLRAFPITQPEEALSQNVAIRARQIGRMSNEYSEEFILQALNQMLLARVPKDQIAQRFGVTTRTIYNWERRLFAKMRDDAKNMDPNTFLGESLEFYKQLRAAGMALYLTADNLRSKQVGLEQARSAHNDMHKFLHIAGFYDAVKFQPSGASNMDEHSRLANEVAQGAKDILSAFEVLDGDFEDLGDDE